MAQDDSAVNQAENKVSFETLRQHEIEFEVLNRRSKAKLSTDKVDKNLVGLALSGGGIRSGAIGLGIFQGLDRLGILRYVDYLSTVSGGGFAGAYLSSYATKKSLQNCKDQIDDKRNNAPESETATAGPRPLLPITPDNTGRQPQRILEFLDTGRRLNKPLVFSNRYLFGLLLNWIVIFSGLAAVAAGTAWVFRQIYNLKVMDYLALLGFRDDLSICLFPPAVVFLCWVLAWIVSFFRDKSRAAGRVARVLFFVLIVTLGVSFAAIVGAGDIDAAQWFPSAKTGSNERINSWMGTAQTIVLSAVLAGLLPYLNPLKLFRSGAASYTSTFEKYVYAIASRALVFGVPFLVMSYFVQENISGWYSHRDGLIYGREIQDWKPFDPIVEEKVNLAKLWGTEGKTQIPPAATVSSTPLASDALQPTEKQLRGIETGEANIGDEKLSLTDVPVEVLFLGARQAGATLEQFHSRFDEYLPVAISDEVRNQEQREFVENDTNGRGVDQTDKRTKSNVLTEKTDVYPWTRWGYYLANLVHDVLPSRARHSEQSDLDRYITASRFQRAVYAEIVRRLNVKLSDPNFAKEFLPEELWEPPSDPRSPSTAPSGTTVADPIESRLAYLKFASADERKAWIMKLKSARENAINVGFYESGGLGLAGEVAPSNSRAQFVVNQQRQAVADANRRLLEIYYGAALVPRDTILSSVVWQHDQTTRARWFFGSLAVFLVAALFVDLNATSCHGFYAKQTAEGWIENIPGVDGDVSLVQLNTTDSQFPYHLICGCVRLTGWKRNQESIHQRNPFLFSKLYCGSERLALVETQNYMNGKYALPDAVAASGGAVSPSESGNPLAGVLLTLTNFRLGQWIENPAFQPRWPQLWQLMRKWPFVPARWLVSMLRPAEDRPYCLVTDGGYYENLGVEALLRRRCKFIISVDAGQDEKHQFEDFVRLVRRARLEYGISLKPLDKRLERQMLDCLSLPQTQHQKPLSSKGSEKKNAKQECTVPTIWTKSHFTPVRIEYPDGTTGLMAYMKSSLTGDEPLELIYYQKKNPAFPHDDTGDQFFDADQFLSYLQLGSHMSENLAKRLENLPLDSLDICDLERRFMTFKKSPRVRDEGEISKDPIQEPPASVSATRAEFANALENAMAFPVSKKDSASVEYWLEESVESIYAKIVEENPEWVAGIIGRMVSRNPTFVKDAILKSLLATRHLPPAKRWQKAVRAVGRSLSQNG